MSRQPTTPRPRSTSKTEGDSVTASLPDTGRPQRRDIAERLTITMSGPDVIDLRSSGDINELGEIPTRDQALALRPRLDDPTRLTNGEIHPRYDQWLAEHSQTDRHPLHSYLHQQKNLHRWTDESGHLNQSAVKRALGRSGPDYWLPAGPVPTKARLPRLAQLLDAPLEEIQAVVEQERHVRQEHQAIVSSCRSLPEKLLTFEQIRAGVPCPGCGRPWIGPQNDIDTDRERWAALHGECRAGRNGYTDSPIHCMRCCGVPAPSPAQIAAVLRILQSASSDRTLQSRPTPIPPEAELEHQRREALRRTRRIEKLEAELATLKAAEVVAKRSFVGTDPDVSS